MISPDTFEALPKSLDEEVEKCEALICEHEKEGRRFLSHHSKEKMRSTPLYLLNEHTDDLTEIKKLVKNKRVGLISDSGLSCIADPGSKLVSFCHQNNIQVKTLPGPSSVFMALQLSGFCSQQFTFHGYLPRKEEELEKAITLMSTGVHVFIEAPYRSDKLLKKLISYLGDNSHLCVCKNLMGPDEYVAVSAVKHWKKKSPVLGKAPTVFVVKK